MVVPDPVLPGQTSVWDYPRPPILVAVARRARIIHAGVTLADSKACLTTLETSHPPTWYLPPTDILMAHLRPNPLGSSVCEWKGRAVYWDVVIAGQELAAVGWSYPDPTPPFAALRDHIAFYAAPFDTVLVDDEPVRPQPGGFYGGWITSDLAGPFKGVPGSRFW